MNTKGNSQHDKSALGPVNQGATKAGKCPHGAGNENPEQSTNNAP